MDTRQNNFLAALPVPNYDGMDDASVSSSPCALPPTSAPTRQQQILCSPSTPSISLNKSLEYSNTHCCLILISPLMTMARMSWLPCPCLLTVQGWEIKDRTGLGKLEDLLKKSDKLGTNTRRWVQKKVQINTRFLVILLKTVLPITGGGHSTLCYRAGLWWEFTKSLWEGPGCSSLKALQGAVPGSSTAEYQESRDPYLGI